MDIQAEMKRQYELLSEERLRVKMFLTENNFMCTSAPGVIVRQYRDAIKNHLEILSMNINEGHEGFKTLAEKVQDLEAEKKSRLQNDI